MTLPVSRELMLSELETTKAVLEAWINKIDTGIPVVDLPAEDYQLGHFLQNLCGDLRVCAGKCETLASTILDSFG